MQGVTDSFSIATDGWMDSDNSIPDSTSIATLGWAESTIIEEGYQEWSPMPNDYFQEENEEYDVESNLFDLLYTEAINLNGIPMVYYVTSLNTRYDKIFGEDNNRNITRNFNVQVYYSLPNEDELFNAGFGLEGLDTFHMEISMRHFETASKYNPQGTKLVYPPYRPLEGDIIKAKYNDYRYEIITVKQQTSQFLKRQHVWDLTVKPLRDESLSVSATVPSNDDIHDVMSIEDIFNISDTVQSEKELSDYDNSNDPPIDPLFGNW
jgi:neck protein